MDCPLGGSNHTVNGDRETQDGRSVKFDSVIWKPEASRASASHSGPFINSDPEQEELVSGRWLVKAILAVTVLAVVALYLTVCLIFYLGQWQFTFFPPKYAPQRKALQGGAFATSWARRHGPPHHIVFPSAAEAASTSGLPITDHPFDTTQEGVNLLDGWWIPASPGTSTQSSPQVLLFCPDGRSNLPGNLAALRAFHALGLSVFAFDYQGFGNSQGKHPTEQKAYQDGLAAFRFVTGMQHIDPHRIVVYGAEVGAAVAAQVALQQPQIAGLVLENPQPSLVKQVRRQQHIHALPMWLIFPNRFDIAPIVPALKMPKLVIATPAQPEFETGASAIYREAAAPKQMVKLNAAQVYTQAAWQRAMRSFIDSLHGQTAPTMSAGGQR